MQSPIKALFIAAIASMGLMMVQVPHARGAESQPAPINVIFDTDMWSDIDDALALAMLHAPS